MIYKSVTINWSTVVKRCINEALDGLGHSLQLCRNGNGKIVSARLVREVSRHKFEQPSVVEVLNMIEIPANMLGLLMIALLAIPRGGKVTSYAAMGKLLGISPRLVGLLLSKNPIPVLVPCHRVIQSDGNIGGYSIRNPAIKNAVDVKRKLLEMEGIIFINGKVPKRFFIDYREHERMFYELYNVYVNQMKTKS